MGATGRNDTCPCGSGKKYKKCCQKKIEGASDVQNFSRKKAANFVRNPSGNDSALILDEINKLAVLFNSERYQELENRTRALVNTYPDAGFAWKFLGASLLVQGKDALPALQKTAALLPDDFEAHNNLGIARQSRGQLEDAVASFSLALRIKPDFAEAHNNLGGVLSDLGLSESAVASFHRAIEIKPDYADAHFNLGNSFRQLGQLEDAVASYRCALKIQPGHFKAYNNLGGALSDLGRFEDAEVSYRGTLAIQPDYADAHNNLGVALHALGYFEDAAAGYRRALAIKPDYADAHFNLGNALRELGQPGDAVASYRRALECNSGYVEAYANLGTTLRDLGLLEEAAATFRRALEIRPDYAEAHSNLGNTLQELGQRENAVACYRRALEIKPDYAEAYTALLFSLSHSEEVDAQSLFAEHCNFGVRFEAPLHASWPRHRNSRDAERRLQVGFVSGDFHNHAVASFIEPILAHLRSHPGLSLHGYYNNTIADGVNQRLRGYLPNWHEISTMTDEALARRICEDGIDILIDLSGHTTGNRLRTFARKPAPVQASWIGYPGTTGLTAMDYFFTDRCFLPRGQFDDQFTEKIAYLPASVSFSPSVDAPSVCSLPAIENTYVTFGSFNRISKLSREVIALWAGILRALPESRMLLGGMPEGGKYDMQIDWFKQEGITPERLDFHPRGGMGDYLRLHQHVDICLDTFPYNGGTTTFHALWMGVPTLTLTGRIPASRSGASILGNIGLDSFVASDAAEFVRRGLYWANNPAELSAIRSGMRDRFARSAMGRPELIAASLERVLRAIWRRWCAEFPAESFEMTEEELTRVTEEAGR